MVEIRKLFTPVASMDPEEAREYLASRAEGSYTLLDVRQPWEYEKEHLPGATLIPLPRLSEQYRQLDPDRPTLVHCAVGGRSRVAVQLLAGLGFKELYNLAGGINAFKGRKAAGPRELNLDLIRGDASPGDAAILAYGLEQNLQTFYEAAAARAADPDLAALCRQLARFEELHEAKLAGLYHELAPSGPDLPAAVKDHGPALLEGGFQPEEFYEQNRGLMDSLTGILELALMLETQALDLYLRFAAKLTQAHAKEVLYTLAQEEKAHLQMLDRLWEEKRAAAAGSGLESAAGEQ